VNLRTNTPTSDSLVAY